MIIEGLEKKEKFEKLLPCRDCRYSGICRYIGSIKPIEVPEFLEVTYVCKKKTELDGKTKNEKV